MDNKTAISTVDQYIASFPEPIQVKLIELHGIIKKEAPEARESISYGMPVYKGKKVLFYFGGFKNHVSFFPTANTVEFFKEELSDYKTSKGTIQFTLDRPLPEELLKRIIKFRMQNDK